MSPTTQPRSNKRIITLALLAGALAAVAAIARHPDILAFASGKQNAAGEHNVMYWYDAMNPEHHYDKPGRAPDGMNLVPAYDDESFAAVQSRSDKQSLLPISSTSDQKHKVLYWYDPMHPSYRSDKQGVAPDCGMALVPKYANDYMANMPAGTVAIPEDKQVLA